MTIVDVSKILGIEKEAINDIISGLESDSLIDIFGGVEPKACKFQLTPKGKTLMEYFKCNLNNGGLCGFEDLNPQAIRRLIQDALRLISELRGQSPTDLMMKINLYNLYYD